MPAPFDIGVAVVVGFTRSRPVEGNDIVEFEAADHCINVKIQRCIEGK